MKKRYINVALLSAVLCAVLVSVTIWNSQVAAFREAVNFPQDAAVEVELWQGGEKVALRVEDSQELLEALRKASYMRRGAVDVIVPEKEAYVLTVLTDNRMETFTVFPQEGIGYLTDETPVMFRRDALVALLISCEREEIPAGG